MNQTFGVVCASLIASVALALFGSSAAAAQSDGQSITARGCVNRAVNNGSLAGGPGLPPTTPNRAAVLANSNEPTDVILLNGATPLPANSETTARDLGSTPPVSYVLDGSLRDLEPHLGHQVEVSGTLQTMNEDAKDAKTMVRHIHVASIKMIATECAKPKSD
jgi:hypothetical protein